MKYFESYLSSSNQYDDIDISVHCDVYIFEWLMRFINCPDNPPELKCKSAVSILISSEFLRMQRLVDICLQFVHDHINEVIKLPIDLNCINSNLVGRLAKLFTPNELEQVEDKRDKLRGKLWMKWVERLLEQKGNVLVCCAECGKVYCRRFGDALTCNRAKPYIDFHGNVISQHVPMPASEWKMRQYIHTMRSQRKTEWRSLYWRLWGMFHMLQCTVCGDAFPACEYGHCVYHPQAPQFAASQNRGMYPCCGKEALRFDTTMRKTGCQARHHTPATFEEPATLGEDETAPDGGGQGESQQAIISTLISRLDVVAVPFVPNSSCGGYADDRVAGLVHGGGTGKGEKASSSSSGGRGDRSSASASGRASAAHSSLSSSSSSSMPRRPGNSKGSRRPSTANSRPSRGGGGGGGRPVTAGRYGRDDNSDSNFRNGIVGYGARSGGRGDTVAAATGWSMAGKAVTTPEAFRVNPQRRRMWKLDLQREDDVVRMEALVRNLEFMRDDGPTNDEYELM